MSGLAKFEMSLNGVGASKLNINGEDFLGRVTGLQVTSYPNEATVLSVTMIGSGEVSGEGIVNIYHEDLSDTKRIISRLSPTKIDHEAINRMSWGDDRSLTEVILEIIKEKLDEAQSQAGRADVGRSYGGRVPD